MELIIYSPTTEQFIKSIDFNHEEIKKELQKSLKKYEGIVYTDDSISNAKTDRATLNKFKDAIETKRKEIKKLCLKPYEDFEAKIKEITAMVDKPIIAIDGQVKAYEQKKREEKRAQIIEIYNGLIGDLAELLPLERIFNDRWLNATFTIKNIETEISGYITKVCEGLKVIGELKTEFELQVKDVFLKTFDLASALTENTRLLAQKARMEEYEKQKSAEVKKPIEPAKKVQEHEPIIEPRQTIIFKVTATSEQFNLIREFFIKNNIEYGRA